MIYLTNGHQKDTLLRQLFAERQSTFVRVQVMDFNQWLQIPAEALNNDWWLVKTMQLVHEQARELKFYQGVDGSLAFAEQLLRLYRQLLSYRCDFASFPTDTQANIDLKRLLLLMIGWPVREQYLLDALASGVDSAGVTVYQYQTLHPLELEILGRLNYQTTLKTMNHVEYYQALNDYEQLEWVAQDIVEHGYRLDQVQLSCPPKLHVPLMNALKRYGIWDGSIGPSKLVQLGLTLNRLVLTSYSVNDLLDITRLWFGVESAGILEQYVLLTKPQVKDFHEPFSALNDHSNQQLLNLYQQAEVIRKQLMERLLGFANWSSLDWGAYTKQMFYELNQFTDSLVAKRELISLKNKWQSLPGNITLGIAALMEHTLNNHVRIDFDLVQVTAHGVLLDVDIHYSIGHQHGTFIPEYTFNGLIDESTVSGLNLMSISERRDVAVAFAKAGFVAKQRLIFMISQITTDGKPLSRNLELEDYFNLAVPIVVEPQLPFHNYLPFATQLSITADEAARIYLKNGQLVGSVSSFEKYNHCQFAYFLSYGLRVRPRDNVQMEVNIVGIILHKVLERLVNAYSFRYCRVNPDDYISLVEVALSDFRSIARYQPVAYQLVSHTLIRQLEQFLMAMRKMENGSMMIPSHTEVQYEHDLGFGVILKGVIDRVDIDPINHWFRVVDYKTSGKEFSALEFINGIQLQLITYLLVGKKQFGEPLGAAYQTLKSSLLRKPAFDMKNAKAKELQDVLPNELANAYMMQGISLVSTDQPRLECLSNNGTRFKGIKLDNNNELKITNKVSCDQHEVFTVLKDLYQSSTKQILAGEIAINPKEGSCTYCEYLPICQFRGVAIKLPKVKGTDNKTLSGGALISYRYGELING
jgi:ATP-dependent helicase/DNAse subunit B